MKILNYSVIILLMILLASSLWAKGDENTNKKIQPDVKFSPSINKNVTLYDRFADGGPFMCPLLVGGIFVVVLSGERSYAFFKKGLFSQDRSFIINDHVQRATSSIEKDSSRRDAIIDLYGNDLFIDLNKGLDSIQLVGALAPMVGFLGTASGMISSFSSIVTSNAVTPKLVAGGIEEALLTTAFGLIIAIPSLVIHHFLSQQVDNALHDFNRIIVDPLVGTNEDKKSS
jgi:hypothetical protein